MSGLADSTMNRIVVFGMPDAGKSALLGALAQVGLTQARVLGGHLQETGGLASLREQLYDASTQETRDEIITYPIQVVPANANQPGRKAVIIDCDGRAANDILMKKNSINQPQNAKRLAEAILTADSLVFVIDAASPPDIRDQDFREFAKFLKHFEERRAYDHGVGGLPVFLVLSKCDKLATPEMNANGWQQIIEDRCHDAANRFREVLADEPGTSSNFWKFGSIDFHVRPCSVKRPQLVDLPAQHREPYGVAELFHEVFGDAATFQARAVKSQTTLSYMLAGIAGVLGTLTVGGSLLFNQPVGPISSDGLAGKVESLQANEPTGAAGRLAKGVLQKRLKVFQEIQNDPEFASLSELQKNYIRLRVDEAQAYLKYSEDLAALPPLSQCRSIKELNEIERRYTESPVPAVYRSDWVGVDAVLLRERILTKDLVELRSAVNTLITYYHGLKNQASNLLLETTDLSPEWERKSKELIEDAAKSRPFPKADPLRGAAYLFDDVSLAEADWLKMQVRIAHVRDLATSLGLLGNSPLAAPLAPVANANAADAIAAANRRYVSLKKMYPDCNRWTLADMPDAVLPEFQKRLKRTADELARDGQQIMLERLKTLNSNGKDAPADWPRVAEYLLTPTVQDWRELTDFTFRLLDPQKTDTVEVAAKFMREAKFDFQFKRLTLKIPDSLTDQVVRPASDFVISQRKTPTSEPQQIKLKLVGEPKREQQSLLYTFAVDGSANLTVIPGDIVTAELLVKKSETEFKLSWITTRTQTYQFDVLQSPPRLHDAKSPPTQGIPAIGVTLTITDGTTHPVPALLPLVK